MLANTFEGETMGIQMLIAIAMMCQVTSTDPTISYYGVQLLQRKCQREMINCAETLYLNSTEAERQSADVLSGALASCVKKVD
jgi:hypothetical protein